MLIKELFKLIQLLLREQWDLYVQVHIQVSLIVLTWNWHALALNDGDLAGLNDVLARNADDASI